MKYLTLLPLIISFGLFSQIPTDGLMAFYPFNNNTLDTSGLNNDAIAGGCTFTEDRFGNENAALFLNGIRCVSTCLYDGLFSALCANR